jgi:hypothetical protein
VFYFVQKNEIFRKFQLGIFEAEANAAWQSRWRERWGKGGGAAVRHKKAK